MQTTPKPSLKTRRLVAGGYVPAKLCVVLRQREERLRQRAERAAKRGVRRG